MSCNVVGVERAVRFGAGGALLVGGLLGPEEAPRLSAGGLPRQDGGDLLPHRGAGRTRLLPGEYLGCPVVMYDDSFYEWSNAKATSVSTDQATR